MFGPIRKVTTVAIVCACVTGLVAWILGDDRIPFARVAQQGVREKFTRMVDEYALELERAKKTVAEARKRAGRLLAARHQAAAKAESLQQAISVAQRELGDARAELAFIEQRLVSREAIRLVSGRLASPAELKVVVATKGERIKLAEEKIRYLEAFLQKRKQVLSKLERAAAQTPATLSRLNLSVDLLERKLRLYQEMRALAEEDEESGVDLKLFRTAQNALERGHAAVDSRLAELSAILEIEVELAPVDDKPDEDVTVEDVLAGIRTVLTKATSLVAVD